MLDYLVHSLVGLMTARLIGWLIDFRNCDICGRCKNDPDSFEYDDDISDQYDDDDDQYDNNAFIGRRKRKADVSHNHICVRFSVK